ncbi:hypothetical protein TNCV_2724321 [Trichonephila clavipes]|nr:hypothetical protein TNCV_2724321 [Trichonephila clavipes]
MRKGKPKSSNCPLNLMINILIGVAAVFVEGGVFVIQVKRQTWRKCKKGFPQVAIGQMRGADQSLSSWIAADPKLPNIEWHKCQLFDINTSLNKSQD